MYISAGGRVFSRMTNTNPRGQSGSQDDVSGERGSNRVPQFSGQSMSFTMATGGPHAARKIVVNFDASFGNCTADAVRGKQPGANTTIGRSMITGRMNEIQSASVSAVSCRVQAGNVFGGG